MIDNDVKLANSKNGIIEIIENIRSQMQESIELTKAKKNPHKMIP